MVKRQLPPFVYLRKGRYAYFERGKVCQRMPDPGTPEFHREYARLTDGGKPADHGPRTFAALVKAYRVSPEYKRLAPRTRADYEKVLDYIVARIGKLPVAAMKAKDVRRAQVETDRGVRFGNYIVSVLSVILEQARVAGWRDDNPARGIKKVKADGIDRQPWPDDMIAAYRAAATGRALLVFELCIGTGQRIGDVLRMRWDHIADGGINVRQGKTGRELWVPMPPRLTATLAQTARSGLTIVTGAHGRPASYRVVADEILAVRRKIGADAYDIHALRYTAAAQMAAMGRSDDEIAAITGHASKQMLDKYAGKVRQITRAKIAQEGRD